MNLSKQQIAELTDEQMDAYAKACNDIERRKRRLVEDAKGFNRPIFLYVLLILSIAGLLFSGAWPLAIGVMLVVGYVQESTNRRINALIELLEIDKEPPLVTPSSPLKVADESGASPAR